MVYKLLIGPNQKNPRYFFQAKIPENPFFEELWRCFVAFNPMLSRRSVTLTKFFQWLVEMT